MSARESLLNRAINALPFELHIPGYQYCGPGTRLVKRLARGDLGINQLDAACREHDIAYSRRPDLPARHIADKELAEQATRRARAGDAGFGERAAAWMIAQIMRAKVKMGAGLTQRVARKKQSRKKRRGKGRVLNPAKRGGFLPLLLPLLAGLSAVGSIAGGASSIAKSVNQAANARKLLAETERHNRAMEQGGRGLYLKPYKKGAGVHKKRKKKTRKRKQ